MAEKDLNLTRIGVFYDGNYFLHVSNYYNFHHERKNRLSIAGLHHFIRNEVANQEKTDERLCQIVDAHYFRGRLSAHQAQAISNSLYNERLFDDILSSEGVTTHYLPVKINHDGSKQEKGIDVWLALEAFELAFYKRFNVLVLIASDGDYVPLIRKLNTLGTRVMVLSWDFIYSGFDGRERETRTSQDLLEEVTYPVAMHEIIDNRVRKNDPVINGLFVASNNYRKDETRSMNRESKNLVGKVFNIKTGFAFIKHENYPQNLFFTYNNLTNADFNELIEGEEVHFTVGKNSKGEFVANEVAKL